MIRCITNGIVLTMNSDREIIDSGAVVIENNLIKDYGSIEEIKKKYEFDEVIDAEGGIIMPGFINGHCHVSMSIFKGIGEDVPDRLRKFLFPLEEKLVDKELVYKGAKLSIAEMLLAGVTTFVDMYYYEDEVAKAAKEMGIRCIAGESTLNKNTPDSEIPYGGIDYAKSFIEKWKDDELITPAIAPHATYTNDAEHLKIIDEISKKYEVPILMHISEMDFEIKMFSEEHNMTPTEYLESIGFLSNRIIGAHFTYMTENDIEILKKHDVGVVHNVTSNAKSARVISPVLEMREAGIRVGLGTDGPMSSNHQDIISVMHQYTKVQKINCGDRSKATAIGAVEMGTIDGARSINMDDTIGSIEKGKKADIIIVETSTPNMTPLYNCYSNLVYSAYPSNVVFTMVNGQVLVKNKELIRSNLKEIINDANGLKDKVYSVVGPQQ
jgi:cytosine/adenosine deaminase-related metal-dependent hydrolase